MQIKRGATMTFLDTNHVKLNELIRMFTNITNIAVGYYSKKFVISSAQQFWNENKNEKEIFPFLYKNVETVECFLHDKETAIYYFSLWVPTLEGFIIVGPYQSLDTLPEKCRVILQLTGMLHTDRTYVSEHQSVRTMMNSLVRHYFYYYPGIVQSDDWITKELNGFHADYVYYPYTLEKEFLDYFRETDPATFEVLSEIESQSNIKFGSGDPQRHLKNKLITIGTILSRTIIESGVPASEALTMNINYLFEIEKADNLRQLNELNSKILDSFFTMIQKERHETFTPFVRKIRDFIYAHLNERVDVQSVADHMNLSAGYVSTVFKQECGLSLKRYILEEKIKEAKRMLHYSDISISDIAVSLCFNDQTYFTKVFKKIAKQTPLQYRKNRPPLP
ncbi:helix-turn-helix domain-containing protein [Salibacterium salarium]|uniref:Helix-turn-helix domain-containing protein n=2 Tax=Salibacterium salarium TaxID=284579 RepID=A0A428MTA5_9BACI|nr:helix-turn-helix domain-containing protein [Salibacterium salarium]